MVNDKKDDTNSYIVCRGASSNLNVSLIISVAALETHPRCVHVTRDRADVNEGPTSSHQPLKTFTLTIFAGRLEMQLLGWVHNIPKGKDVK